MPTDVGATEYEIEDFLLYDMQCKASRAMETSASADNEDVYTCLAEKESNLVLAAELGKALLTRNEALALENERLAEDFSRKLEVSSAQCTYKLGSSTGKRVLWAKSTFVRPFQLAVSFNILLRNR